MLLPLIVAGLLSPQQIQVDESLDLTRQNWAPAASFASGGGTRGAACDDFNRPDGPLGANWTNVSGTQEIRSNTIQGISGGNAWARYTGTTEPYATAVVEIDVQPNPTGVLRYSAIVTGEDNGGGDMLYTKVQNQTGLAGYSHYAFYVGFNGGGSGSYGGFFSFGFQVDAANNGIHMLVESIGDVTWLRLDDDLNGTYEYNFNSGGTASSTGRTFGTSLGHGTYGDGNSDNYEVNGGCGAPPLTLNKQGPCPGLMTLTVNGATPGGQVAIVWGLTAPFVIPPGKPCVGTALGVTPLNPNAFAVGVANAQGTATFTGNVPAAACGRIEVQAIDLQTCRTSNVIVL